MPDGPGECPGAGPVAIACASRRPGGSTRSCCPCPGPPIARAPDAVTPVGLENPAGRGPVATRFRQRRPRTAGAPGRCRSPGRKCSPRCTQPRHARPVTRPAARPGGIDTFAGSVAVASARSAWGVGGVARHGADTAAGALERNGLEAGPRPHLGSLRLSARRGRRLRNQCGRSATTSTRVGC
jgi:hypothetical protein